MVSVAYGPSWREARPTGGPVLLVGPICCGKTYLSDRLDFEVIHVDDLQDDMIGDGSVSASMRVRRERELAVLERAMRIEADGVLVVDCGAGHAVFDGTDDENAMLTGLLADSSLVIGLMPHQDPQRSFGVLTKRLQDRDGWHPDPELLQWWVDGAAVQAADVVVYTGDSELGELAAVVADLIVGDLSSLAI